MTHGESLQEGAAARYLEISPFVKSYVAQAAKEIYYDDAGNPHHYFVDFRVTLTNDEEVDVEVKPNDRLDDPAVRRKYQLIASAYAEKGRRFRVLTDLDYGVDPLHDNLKLLNYHGSKRIPGLDLGKLEQALEAVHFSTVAEAGEFVGGIANVYRLIAYGFLAIDFNEKLSPASGTWIRREGDGDDSLRL